MIDTPHRDKALYNADVSDFDTELDLTHYGLNFRYYKISCVPCALPGRASIRRIRSAFARHSAPRSATEPAMGLPSASSLPMVGAGRGQG